MSDVGLRALRGLLGPVASACTLAPYGATMDIEDRRNRVRELRSVVVVLCYRAELDGSDIFSNVLLCSVSTFSDHLRNLTPLAPSLT